MTARTRVVREHTSNTDTAFLAIREMIVSGRLAPGGWIVEADLASVLKMSRTPIRAALQWLQHEGYVEARQTGSKSRMMVTPLTLSDARELYGIVGRIEGMAGHFTSSLSPKMRSLLVATLKKLNSEMVKTAKALNPEPERFANIDTAFHDRIVEACGGSRLLAIYKAIKPQTDRYYRLYLTTVADDMKASCLEHDAIIESVSKGNGEDVERALQVNWENGAERLAKAIMKFGERGAW